MPLLTGARPVAAAAGVLVGPPPTAIAGGLLLGVRAARAGADRAPVPASDAQPRWNGPCSRPALSLATLIVSGLLLYVAGFRLDRTSWTLAAAGSRWWRWR